MCVSLCTYICIHLCICVYLYTEVPSASRSEEEAGGEVRDGWSDRSVADMYRLVSTALHVTHQICSWSCQSTARRVSDHHTGRLPGNLTCTYTPGSYLPALTHLYQLTCTNSPVYCTHQNVT